MEVSSYILQRIRFCGINCFTLFHLLYAVCLQRFKNKIKYTFAHYVDIRENDECSYDFILTNWEVFRRCVCNEITRYAF